MKNILEVLTLSTDYLKQRGIVNPRRQAEDLVADALNMARLNLYVEFDRPLSENELDLCRKNLGRRAKGEPLQYIRGFVEFCDCRISVSRDVLIPRQETEILAEKIIKELEKKDCKGKVLWDVCTGSGCLGIAIKKRIPDLHVVLSDISAPALNMAQRNAEANGVAVDFKQGDLLEPFKGQTCDFLVSNPPYISQNEFLNLEAEVKNFEPAEALIGGKTGVEFYGRFSKELPAFLNPGAICWFELGTGQGKEVLGLFSGMPWKSCRYEEDWSGHDRFFFLEIE